MQRVRAVEHMLDLDEVHLSMVGGNFALRSRLKQRAL